jgi:2-desacetyl-2-hydroxyethyl bacteriochlorophyllide A dehydrogenase
VRGVVFDELGKVEVVDLPEPVIEEPGDAIVRVTCAAICGSDMHFVHGKAPMEPGEGIGHEAVGIVDSVGEHVTRFLPGDRVVVAFNIACGACWFCRRGQTQLCEDFRNLGAGTFGGSLGGAQAERLRVPGADVNLLAIPDGVEDERALFVGDVLTTGYYGAAVAGIEPGDVVAVVGAGPLGFFTAQAARMLGAARVFVLEMEPGRLSLAASVGAEPIDVRKRHPVTTLAEATGGRGADAVIEAVGSPSAFETAVDVVRRGGRVVVLGVYTSEAIELQLGVYWARALDLRFAGVCPVHAWWELAMQAVLDGSIDPEPIVSHRLPLDEAPRGYDLFHRREASKVVLIP